MPSGVVAAALVLASAVIAGYGDKLGLMNEGDGFKPRLETVDELAGLAIGAFVVDRLITFMPPLFAARPAAQRAADITVLRVGWGAVFGALFVIATDLRSVAALSDETTVGAGWDRAITVVAIAGGVAGLARLYGALNPKATDGEITGTNKIVATKPAEAVVAVSSGGVGGADAQAEAVAPPVAGAAAGAPGVVATPGTPGTPGTPLTPLAPVPPPSPAAYGVAWFCLLAALLFAILAAGGDETGTDLKGLAEQANADGTVDVIIRFAPVILAAAVVEQLVERLVAPFVPAHNKGVVTGAATVVLAAIFAKLAFDLYLLHNVGFFGSEGAATVNDALKASSETERWGDLFFTTLVIAAGTKSLHDLSDRLRKAKPAATGEAV